MKEPSFVVYALRRGVTTYLNVIKWPGKEISEVAIETSIRKRITKGIIGKVMKEYEYINPQAVFWRRDRQQEDTELYISSDLSSIGKNISLLEAKELDYVYFIYP